MGPRLAESRNQRHAHARHSRRVGTTTHIFHRSCCGDSPPAELRPHDETCAPLLLIPHSGICALCRAMCWRRARAAWRCGHEQGLVTAATRCPRGITWPIIAPPANAHHHFASPSRLCAARHAPSSSRVSRYRPKRRAPPPPPHCSARRNSVTRPGGTCGCRSHQGH